LCFGIDCVVHAAAIVGPSSHTPSVPSQPTPLLCANAMCFYYVTTPHAPCCKITVQLVYWEGVKGGRSVKEAWEDRS
jgi:hypothetical protein